MVPSFLRNLDLVGAGRRVRRAPSVSTTVGGIGTHTLGSTENTIADVQSWLDSPATNFGWILRGDESSAGDARRVDSRENLTAANRPTLTITYSEPAPVPLPRLGVGLLALALLGAALKRVPLGR